MKKDPVPPVSEQCTEEETAFISGQQVVPKSSGTVNNVVSVSMSLSPALCKSLTLPYTTKSVERQSYPFHETADPDQSPVNIKGMMAFADSNPAYVSAVVLINRSVFGHSKCDLPNESAKTEKKIFGVVIQEEKAVYNPVVASILKFFAAGGDNYVRKCPGGRGATGGGAVSGNNGGGNSGYASATQWVTGYSGGGVGGYLPSGGGDGDDDPFNNYRPSDIPRGHYMEPGFQAEDHLDKLTEEILKDGDLFRELGLELPEQQSFELQLQPLPDAQAARGRYEEYSDPAPMTPGNPMTPCMPLKSPAQVTSTPVSEVKSLLEIQTLLRTPPVQMSIPQQPTSPGYSNLPNTMVGHQTAPVYNSQMPLASPLAPSMYQQQQQQQQSSPSDFFVMTHYQNGNNRCVKMAIKNARDHQAYDALKFCWDLFVKYDKILQQDCTLPIATQGKAKLCSMKVDVNGGLLFSLPVDCCPLNEWIEKNNDLRMRHLVIQQVLNALVVLFQGENNLSFWGSFEVFVASNMQVYLYIDFNKSLSVQKVYACSGQFNSRIEDCRMLKELFELLLMPYLTNSFLVSPQLSSILNTFQQLLTSPALQTSCVDQIAKMARVLGERRMCCMQAQIYGYPSVYTIYSVEHEPVSQSLSILNTLVRSAVQRPCLVLHEDNSPVSVTEISARHGHGHGHNHRYILVSEDLVPPGQRLPGSLYIE